MRRRTRWLCAGAVAASVAVALAGVRTCGRAARRAASDAGEASRALAAGDAGGAAALARSALAREPGLAPARLVLGLALLRLGRDAEGEDVLRGIPRGPHPGPDDRAAFLEASLVLGWRALDRGEPDEAEHLADAAAATGGSYPALLLRSEVHLRRGDPWAALRAIDEARRQPGADVRADARAGEILRFLARATGDAEFGRRAAAAWTAGLDRTADDRREAEIHATAAVELGLHATAITDLEGQTSARAARLRAAALRGIGADAPAEAELCDRIRASPTAELHADHVMFLVTARRLDDAEVAAAAAVRSFPGDPGVRAALLALRRARRIAAAPSRRLLAAVVERRPGTADPYDAQIAAWTAAAARPETRRLRIELAGPDRVSEVLADAADPADVAAFEADLTEVLREDPQDRAALQWSAALELARGAADRAATACHRILADGGESAVTHAIRALAASSRGQHAPAAAAAARACVLAPDSEAVAAVSAHVSTAGGDAGRAASTARASLAAAPQDVCLLAVLADAIRAGAAASPGEPSALGAVLAARRGDAPEAVRLFDLAVREGGTPGQAADVPELVWGTEAARLAAARGREPADSVLSLREAEALLRARRPAAARRVLDAAVRAGRATPAALMLLGEIHTAAGDAEAAAAAFLGAAADESFAAPARIALAWIEIERGERVPAAANLRAVIAGSAAAADKLRALRALLLAASPQEADVAAAETWLGSAGESVSPTAAAWCAACVAQARGRPDEARAAADAACAAAPSDADARVVAAVIADRADRLADAQSHARAALAAAPGRREVRSVAGQVHLRAALSALGAGRARDAADAAREAIVGAASDEAAALLLARAHAMCGTPDVAASDADALDRSAPGTTLGPLLRAETFLLANSPAAAVAPAREALLRAPRSAPALALLTAAELASRRPGGAEAACRREIAERDGWVGAHRLLGNVLEARGDRDGALASYVAGLARAPSDLLALRRAVPILVAQGQSAKAQALVRAAQQGLAPPGADAAEARRVAEAGDADGGVDLARRAGVRIELGRCWLLAGDAEEARASFESALAADPSRPAAYFGLLGAFHRLGRSGDAARWFADAAASRPGDAQAWCVLGILAESAGDVATAERHYRRALACDGAHPVAANNLAWMLAVTSGRPAEGLPLASTAARAAPGDADVADTHAWILHLTGDRAAAAAEAARACRLRPRDARFQLRRGEICGAAGDGAEAVAAYRTAAALDTEYVERSASAALRGRVARTH